jgi:hypothetical protein
MNQEKIKMSTPTIIWIGLVMLSVLIAGYYFALKKAPNHEKILPPIFTVLATITITLSGWKVASNAQKEMMRIQIYDRATSDLLVKLRIYRDWLNELRLMVQPADYFFMDMRSGWDKEDWAGFAEEFLGKRSKDSRQNDWIAPLNQYFILYPEFKKEFLTILQNRQIEVGRIPNRFGQLSNNLTRDQIMAHLKSGLQNESALYTQYLQIGVLIDYINQQYFEIMFPEKMKTIKPDKFYFDVDRKLIVVNGKAPE